MTPSYAVVVPTVGRPSLYRLLAALAAQSREIRPTEVVVVDDRPPGRPPLEVRVGELVPRLVASGGRGPAAARNLGWWRVSAEWVAFLDDDVEPTPAWGAQLAADLGACVPDVGGSKGRVRVPLPADRRPTDAERKIAALESAAWITADMAYRRDALRQVGGFDERFRRAYREDAELALRLQRAGWLLVRGDRVVVHPVRPSGEWTSLRAQVGNADDALMRRLHGPRWRRPAQAPRGRLPWHVVTSATAVGAVAAGLAGARRAAAAAAVAWAALTAEFAWHRLSHGPPTVAEVRRMVLTSVAIPPVAVAYRLAGAWRYRRVAGHLRGRP